MALISKKPDPFINSVVHCPSK
ncbi:hypothetical protein CCACVL1_13138 [Corchorus capsularis]|uniref:Uncharacterized protein n=1 Tax=Corchorus capsularis TaxID=210143 RepID=A0A1R3IC85_COCAP|nr:hypothetical protein CCACVL1_13138 [Corchorus capsularis]